MYFLLHKCNLHQLKALLSDYSEDADKSLKEQITKKVIEELIPLPLVALEHGVSRSALQSWVRSVKREGYISLYQENKRGRPPIKMRQSRKKEPQTALEKLQAENERLRAENALLKKVKALVEEREARERMTGLKPSKN